MGLVTLICIVYVSMLEYPALNAGYSVWLICMACFHIAHDGMSAHLQDYLLHSLYCVRDMASAIGQRFFDFTRTACFAHVTLIELIGLKTTDAFWPFNIVFFLHITGL